MVIDNLPGYPDNINLASDGHYWLALVGMRCPAYDLAMRLIEHPVISRQQHNVNIIGFFAINPPLGNYHYFIKRICFLVNPVYQGGAPRGYFNPLGGRVRLLGLLDYGTMLTVPKILLTSWAVKGKIAFDIFFVT